MRADSENFVEHVKRCSECGGGKLCAKGRRLFEQGLPRMFATMDGGSATARASFVTGEGILIGPAQGDKFDIQWMPPGHHEITCHVGDPESGLPKPHDLDFTAKAEQR